MDLGWFLLGTIDTMAISHTHLVISGSLANPVHCSCEITAKILGGGISLSDGVLS